MPLKLYYSVKCFRNEPVTDLSLRKKREFKQVGLELLGPTYEMADVEVIYLILKGLESIGIPKDRINVRLGNMRLFSQLCNNYNIKDDDKIMLKEKFDKLAEYKAIEKESKIIELEKDINFYLENIGLSSSDLALWKKMYSGKRKIEETLDIIRNDFKNLGVANTLKNISDILKFLKVPFEIDTCVVRSHEYYTDTVFEVDVKGKNKTYLEIAGGGRYNKLITNLLENTTISIPATGFAYGLERVLNIIMDEGIGKSSSTIKYFLDEKSTEYIIFSKEIKKVLKKAEELRKNWNRVDIYFQDKDKEKAKLYAKRKNALFLEI